MPAAETPSSGDSTSLQYLLYGGSVTLLLAAPLAYLYGDKMLAWMGYARASEIDDGSPKPKVVVVGGGMAGACVAKELESHADVTLVDSKEYFEIPWAVLRILVEPPVAEQALWPHAAYLKKAALKVGTAKSATDKDVTLEDGTLLPFDYLVIATGSPPIKAYPSLEQRKSYFGQEHDKIRGADKVLIVGGGPVGVELAAEIATDYPDKKVTLVHGGSRLMEFVGEKASAMALNWLQKKGVTVLLNDKVDVTKGQQGTKGTFKTASGSDIETDYLYVATGTRPDLSWLQDGLAAAVDGGRVQVDYSFKVDGHENIFAVGDTTNIPEAKQGYLAKQHGDIAAENIRRLIKAKGGSVALKKYSLSPDVALVSLGRADGIAQLPFGTFSGWFPAFMKSKGLFIGKVRGDLGVPK